MLLDLTVEVLGNPLSDHVKEELGKGFSSFGIRLVWIEASSSRMEVSWESDGVVAHGMPAWSRTGAVRIVYCQQLKVREEPAYVHVVSDDWDVSPLWRNTLLTTEASAAAVGSALACAVLGYRGNEDAAPRWTADGLVLSSHQLLQIRDRVRFELQGPPQQERGRILWVYANPYTDTIAGPYGLDILSQIARNLGFRTRITNPFVEAMEPEDGLRNLVRSYRPHLIGVSLRNIDDALIVHSANGAPDTIDTRDLLSDVRRLLSVLDGFDGPTILGGAAFGTAPEVFLKMLGLPYGVIGAADAALAQLCEVWRPEEHGPAAFHTIWRGLPGAVWRDNECYKRNPPARERMLVQAPALQRTLPYLMLERRDRLPVAVRGSQGCALGCSYCLESVNRKTVTWRNVIAVVDEMEFAQRHYGARVFHLTDSEANIPFSRLTDLADEILRRGLGDRILWTAYLNVRPFEPEAVPLLAASGLYRLKFAFDHFHDEMLRSYHKNFREADLTRLLTGLALHAQRVQVMAGILLGGPGETEETLAYAVQRMEAEASRGIVFYYNTGVRVYPGTPYAARWAAAPDEPGYFGPGRKDGGISPLVYCAPLPPRLLAARLELRFANIPGIFRMSQVRSCTLGYEGYRRFLVAWHAWLRGCQGEAAAVLDGIPNLDTDRQAFALRRLIRMRQATRGKADAHVEGGLERGQDLSGTSASFADEF